MKCLAELLIEKRYLEWKNSEISPDLASLHNRKTKRLHFPQLILHWHKQHSMLLPREFHEILGIYGAWKSPFRTLRISPPGSIPRSDIETTNYWPQKLAEVQKDSLYLGGFKNGHFGKKKWMKTTHVWTVLASPGFDHGRYNLDTTRFSMKDTCMQHLRIFWQGRQKCFRKVTIRHTDAYELTPEAPRSPPVKRLFGNAFPLWSYRRARTNNLHLVRP